MKRLSMAMTALAVMGLMTMVSCRKPNVNNVVPGAARTVTFNATTESGNGSKTYLEDSYVKWSAGDQISVNGNDDTHKLKLEDGAGTTFGRFTGTITAAAPYLVGYPADALNNGSNITFTIDDEQDGDPDFDSKLPMAAYTANENGDLSFRNMANVLMLSLTGNQNLTKIEVESAAENLSGNFTVNSDLVPTAVNAGTITKKITVTKNMTLTGTPQTVYVVLPVFGSAESTITVKFTGDAGVMTVGPKALAGSNTPNHRYCASVNVQLETPWSASVVTIPVCAVHKNCASSGGVVTGTGVEEQGICWGTSENPTIDGSHYIHQYAYSLSPLKLTPKDETTNNTFTGFMSGLTANTTYHVRAYIKKGSKVVYGDDVEFKTLTDAEEPAVTGVNLGLPSGTLWATCNLGAKTPEGYGDYYQWGDLAACSTISSGTTCYVSCSWQSYRFAANSTSTFTKYCPSDKTSYWYNYSPGTNDPDNNLQLDMTDDCVRQTLGDGWRMPTEAEFSELISNTTRTLKAAGASITIGGNTVSMPVAGRYIVSTKEGYTDKYIFLPAAGLRRGASLDYAGSNGYYWSSSLDTSNPYYGRRFYFSSSGFHMNDYSRYSGHTVRPVR